MKSKRRPGGNQEPTKSATVVAAPRQTQGDSPVATDVASIGGKTAPRFVERVARSLRKGLQLARDKTSSVQRYVSGLILSYALVRQSFRNADGENRPCGGLEVLLGRVA